VDFVTVTTRIRDILNLYYDANDWQKLPWRRQKLLRPSCNRLNIL
jgi:hypothetical protein